MLLLKSLNSVLVQINSMRKVVGSFLFVLLFLSEVKSQDFWLTIPFPDSLNITCMDFNKAGEIFVGTNTDTAFDGVFRSQDEGQTWELILNMGKYGPMSLAINDSGVIYVLGAATNWYLTKSADNGQTWESLSIPDYGGNIKIVAHGTDTLFVSQWASNGACLLRSVNGGYDWTVVFETQNHTSENVSDIAIAPNGDIFISLMCYFPNMGGVYKSMDGGNTWEFLGLLSHQVKEVEVNEQGDVFIGVFSDFEQGGGGIYAIYHDNPQLVECFTGPHINGLCINSAGHLYAGTGWPDGVAISKDNGLSFSFENTGLPNFPMRATQKDFFNYVYARPDAPSNLIYRTTNPTVGISRQKTYNPLTISIYPNPATNCITCKIPTHLANKTIDYKIFDIFGNEILKGVANPVYSTFAIDITSLKNACFCITLTTKETIYYSKFIKNQLS
jgi:hypothetical protein